MPPDLPAEATAERTIGAATVDRRQPMLTVVTPSFEKHAVQFDGMLHSLQLHCLDLPSIELILIIEEKNEPLFSRILARYDRIRSRMIFTEDVLAEFGIVDTPSAFLGRIGKFTFQTVKKFGGLIAARSEWSLVLDSECLFHKPFNAVQLLDDYRAQKYVFYTWTSPRGRLWYNSTGFHVTENCARALSMRAGDRWYMEYFHWFYETDKIVDLVKNQLGPIFFGALADPTVSQVEYFENILYYLYLQKCHATEYEFIDFKQAVDECLPAHLSARFKLAEMPFALFGNEYLLNILGPDDVPALAPLFARFKLPFVRLEPPFFSTRYLPELAKLPTFVATISSHHIMWLRKKIAVCISGEFRHIVHRTPEQQVRHLQGFLSGVDCDVYLHGWSNSSEALILDGLKPRAHKFEAQPSFAALARRIGVTEPNIKPRRDEGSLAMLYGIEQASRLMEQNEAEYDYVLRIRPDLYSELSLKEIMVKISDEGDFLPNAIYFPAKFHSKGINDQIAIGPVALMKIYARTYTYAANNIERIFFNPETVLLRNLLENEVELALVDMPYALMREVPFKIGTIFETFQRQFHVWWSRTDELPRFQDLTAYFSDKLKAVDAMMRNLVPELVYIRGPQHAPNGHDGRAVIRAKIFENDPSRPAVGLFRGAALWRLEPFDIDGGAIRKLDAAVGRQLFVWPDGDTFNVSEWKMRGGRLINDRMRVPAEDVSPKARQFGIRIRLALFLDRRRQARRDAAIRRAGQRAQLKDRLRRGLGWRHRA